MSHSIYGGIHVWPRPNELDCVLLTYITSSVSEKMISKQFRWFYTYFVWLNVVGSNLFIPTIYVGGQGISIWLD